MKFLCVACDQAMKLIRTEGPTEGSMMVVFSCPDCGKETAMLTNTMETQMVRSLGVTIGGRTVPAEPMEMVRNSLAHGLPGTSKAGRNCARRLSPLPSGADNRRYSWGRGNTLRPEQGVRSAPAPQGGVGSPATTARRVRSPHPES